jgi:ubiquinone/menaquinone biosynthesis C-methylase UbiE
VQSCARGSEAFERHRERDTRSMSETQFDRVQPMVRASYDRLAPRFASWADRVTPDLRVAYAARIINQLEPTSTVVELGCGPGAPVGKMIADHCRYVGVDLSFEMLRQARAAIPRGLLVQADMTELGFRPTRVDAVLAFYSLIHVPRELHENVLRLIVTWLRPGGLVAVIVSFSDMAVGYEANWLEAGPMFWSSYDRSTVEETFRRVGLDIREASEEHVVEDADEIDVLCVLAVHD